MPNNHHLSVGHPSDGMPVPPSLILRRTMTQVLRINVCCFQGVIAIAQNKYPSKVGMVW